LRAIPKLGFQTGVTDMDIVLVIGAVALFALAFAYTKICNNI
jgi:hypothetical protein